MKATVEQDFFVSKDKSVKKLFMHKTDDFKYAESKELDAKVNYVTNMK